MAYHFDQNCQIKGQSGVVYTARIRITQDAWDKADADAQNQTNAILNNQPIQLLSASGRGPGIKWEGNGWSMHTNK